MINKKILIVLAGIMTGVLATGCSSLSGQEKSQGDEFETQSARNVANFGGTRGTTSTTIGPKNLGGSENPRNNGGVMMGATNGGNAFDEISVKPEGSNTTILDGGITGNTDDGSVCNGSFVFMYRHTQGESTIKPETDLDRCACDTDPMKKDCSGFESTSITLNGTCYDEHEIIDENNELEHIFDVYNYKPAAPIGSAMCQCGDGNKSDNEQCDLGSFGGTFADGATIEGENGELMLVDGLTCTSSCELKGFCGDEYVDQSGEYGVPEECDEQEYNGKECFDPNSITCSYCAKTCEGVMRSYYVDAGISLSNVEVVLENDSHLAEFQTDCRVTMSEHSNLENFVGPAVSITIDDRHTGGFEKKAYNSIATQQRAIQTGGYVESLVLHQYDNGSETEIVIDLTSCEADISGGGQNASAFANCIKTEITDVLTTTYNLVAGDNFSFHVTGGGTNLDGFTLGISFDNKHNPSGKWVGLKKGYSDTLTYYYSQTSQNPGRYSLSTNGAGGLTVVCREQRQICEEEIIQIYSVEDFIDLENSNYAYISTIQNPEMTPYTNGQSWGNFINNNPITCYGN